MHRNIGVSKAIKARQERNAFKEKGAQITEAKLSDMQKQMAQFKTKLESFATKHAKNLNSDPEFRNKFQRMCAAIGVDPLSSSKGFWAEVLGVGQYFYELGVQTLHVCLATRDMNGGILQLSSLQQYLQILRGKQNSVVKGKLRDTINLVTEDDLRRAVALLEPLGNGVRLVQVGKRTMLISVPLELSSDHTTILDIAHDNKGKVSLHTLETRLNWDRERIQRALQLLQSQGMAWLDTGSPDKESLYWFPAIRLSLV
jgi:ESCRT-II complex subunit VPS22